MTKKVKLTFNLMDFLILLAILAAAAVALYVFVLSADKNDTASDTVKLRYVIEIKGVRDEFSGCINTGDPVTENTKLYPVGEVVAFEYRDSVWKGVNRANASQVVGDYPGKSDFYITIESTATEDADCYNINGYELTVGSYLYMRLPDFYGLGYCISTEIIQ